MEEVKEEVKADTNKQAQQITGNMIDILENSDNQKFRNSKMLKFLKKIRDGAYKVENDVLVKDPEKLIEFREKERIRMAEE